MKSYISLAVAFLFGYTQVCKAAPLNEIVKTMPLMNDGNNFDFKMFSGFIQFPSSSKQIHYLLAES